MVLRKSSAAIALVAVVGGCGGGSGDGIDPFADPIQTRVSGTLGYDPRSDSVRRDDSGTVVHEASDPVVFGNGNAVVTRRGDLNTAAARTGDLFAFSIATDRVGSAQGQLFGDRTPEPAVSGRVEFTGDYIGILDDAAGIVANPLRDVVATPTEFVTGDVRISAEFDTRRVEGRIDNRLLRDASGTAIGTADDLTFLTGIAPDGTFFQNVASGALTRDGLPYRVGAAGLAGVITRDGAVGTLTATHQGNFRTDLIPEPEVLDEYGVFVAN